MKKFVLLFAVLTVLTACSNAVGSGPGYKVDDPINGKRTTYCSCFESTPTHTTSTLELYKLNKNNKLNVLPTGMKSGSQLLNEEDRSDYLLFDNYQKLVDYRAALQAKSEYGRYETTLTYLNTLNESNFENKNLIFSGEIMLASGGYSYTYDAVYLKDKTLYMHANVIDDRTYPAGLGIGFDTSIAYTCGYVWLDKSISFDDFRLVYDVDELRTMVIEY